MLAMDSRLLVGVVISVGYEIWCECGKPDQELWFAHFLAESEENYTWVVVRCLQTLVAKKGDAWLSSQGLIGVCGALVNILDHWD
jgi:hypothetical protein